MGIARRAFSEPSGRAREFFASERVAHAPDYPGFADPICRARRNAIAAIAARHRSGETVPKR